MRIKIILFAWIVMLMSGCSLLPKKHEPYSKLEKCQDIRYRIVYYSAIHPEKRGWEQRDEIDNLTKYYRDQGCP